MTIDDKSSLGSLSQTTTRAAVDARAAGITISRNDFLDMTDGRVSSKDMLVANKWVSLLNGYLDEGSFINKMARWGLTSLPKDLATEQAREMLDAASDLRAAIQSQYDGQSLTARMWEETKD